MRTGITRFLPTLPTSAPMALSTFVLLLVLPALALALGQPAGGWDAATLVATSIVLSLCAEWVRGDIPRLSTVAGSVSGSARAAAAPVLFRLSPAAPGQPRPRAPGRAARARPA